MRTIDPVALREGRVRAAARISASMKLEAATDALLWFHQFATEAEEDRPMAPRRIDPDTLKGVGHLGGEALGKSLIVAASTGNVGKAAPFVAAAFHDMRAAIVSRAIELAQVSLDEANEVLR